MMHIHHIVPKHMGGSDDPSNLVECTIEQHANFHKELWDLHGNEWDRIAWLSLSGQISVSEAKRLAQIEGSRVGGTISSALRKGKGNDIGSWNRVTGHVKTIATPESRKKAGAKVGKMLVESGRWEDIRSRGSIAGGKAAIKALNTKRWRCTECGMESHSGGIGNHQRKTGHIGKDEVCL